MKCVKRIGKVFFLLDRKLGREAHGSEVDDVTLIPEEKMDQEGTQWVSKLMDATLGTNSLLVLLSWSVVTTESNNFLPSFLVLLEVMKMPKMSQ